MHDSSFVNRVFVGDGEIEVRRLNEYIRTLEDWVNSTAVIMYELTHGDDEESYFAGIFSTPEKATQFAQSNKFMAYSIDPIVLDHPEVNLNVPEVRAAYGLPPKEK